MEWDESFIIVAANELDLFHRFFLRIIFSKKIFSIEYLFYLKDYLLASS